MGLVSLCTTNDNDLFSMQHNTQLSITTNEMCIYITLQHRFVYIYLKCFKTLTKTYLNVTMLRRTKRQKKDNNKP